MRIKGRSLYRITRTTCFRSALVVILYQKSVWKSIPTLDPYPRLLTMGATAMLNPHIDALGKTSPMNEPIIESVAMIVSDLKLPHSLP